MTPFLSFLYRPSPYNSRPWIVVVTASLLVGFLLGFFQPFGIDRIPINIKSYIVAGYILVTAISTSIVGYLFPLLFKKFYNPSKWSIGKSLLNNILIISLIILGNTLFDWSIGHHLSKTFGSVLLSYILVTLLIGIIPAIVSIFIVQNYTLKKNLSEVKAMKDKLIERSQNTTHLKNKSDDIVTLTGDTKEAITLHPNNILYIESSGNYVKVSYLSEGIVTQRQIRSTISRTADELSGFPYLSRCHRAYMVNISHITSIEGNSQGLLLALQHLKEKVPVSRSYAKGIREKL